jgi:hypothetical protein
VLALVLVLFLVLLDGGGHSGKGIGWRARRVGRRLFRLRGIGILGGGRRGLGGLLLGGG